MARKIRTTGQKIRVIVTASAGPGHDWQEHLSVRAIVNSVGTWTENKAKKRITVEISGVVEALTPTGATEIERALGKNDAMVKEEAVMSLHGTEMMITKETKRIKMVLSGIGGTSSQDVDMIGIRAWEGIRRKNLNGWTSLTTRSKLTR